jgi:hypothetical protein
MTWRNFGRGALFCAGMAAGAAAGHLFYFDRYISGGAMLLLTAVFLFYAGIDSTEAGEPDAETSEELARSLEALSGLSVLVAENALNAAKYVGRTLPYTLQELSKLEDGLSAVLDSLPVKREDRQRIAQEFEKLRTRSREAGGRRVLLRKS